MAELLLLLLLTVTISYSAADPDTFIFAGCSQFKYEQNSAYGLNVNSALSSLANAASSSTFGKFTSSAASPSSPVYGLFQCRGDISVPDCTSCVRSAISQLSPICPSSAGATIQLDACMIRYGNDSFLGKQDTNLLYKKCGPIPNNGYNADLTAMRDNALGSLVASGGTGGTYRNGAAGYVQAAAQCVGDISAKDCSDCISSAVGQVKAVCGFAVSGDVYLGKCFAKYYSTASSSSSSTYTPSSYNRPNNNGNESGKTVAIIIGLMVGIALLIIFLSFVRRNGNNGKS
ncbi:putative DUF26 domain family protein precursor [Iris pallida]|uniref:DUF26 domain family protein n=1 Tax=Iris pallida TaxID=29817 RepID=A0AAX6DYI9_IRIPA|nr:putative DUF26 domain family protein precursor [Iris pallida]